MTRVKTAFNSHLEKSVTVFTASILEGSVDSFRLTHNIFLLLYLFNYSQFFTANFREQHKSNYLPTIIETICTTTLAKFWLKT